MQRLKKANQSATYSIRLRRRFETPQGAWEPGTYRVPEDMAADVAQRVVSRGIALKVLPALEIK